jgi:hypothetical protein
MAEIQGDASILGPVSSALHAMSELGQKAKYSLGADVFRFAPESGLKSDIAPCPKGADFVAEIGIPTARDGWCIF